MFDYQVSKHPHFDEACRAFALRHNPALREKLFTFEVDILRNDVCDISLNLQLTERVLVSTDGSVSSVEAVAEPDEPEEMWTVKRG